MAIYTKICTFQKFPAIQYLATAVWWPGIDLAVEEPVKRCDPHQRSRYSPAVAPFQPLEWPQRPGVRLHIDYTRPLFGHMFLVIVDAYSKCMEIKVSKTATSTLTIEHLRTLLATHGLPELIVSETGSVFTIAKFKSFRE